MRETLLSYATTERGGFEPPNDVTAVNGFRDRRFQPLSHLSSETQHKAVAAAGKRFGARAAERALGSGDGRQGANAVVAMRFDCNEIAGVMSEAAAYGTAVTLARR